VLGIAMVFSAVIFLSAHARTQARLSQPVTELQPDSSVL
jgi:hypothetical protein